MPGALSLALTPAPLIIALALQALAPRAVARLRRVIGAAALGGTLALLAVDALPVAGGGHILVSVGGAVTGVPYLFRADGVAMLVAVSATASALLLLAPGLLDASRVTPLLVCVSGSLIAAFAGNAVMLFAGVEVANVGVFMLLTVGARRPGRGALLALVVEHAAALGLLAAAANLQVTVGTSDFTALPPGAVTIAVAVPWGLSAALRLASPAVVPQRTRVPTVAWAATAAVPVGVAMVLRLREASGGAEPLPATVTLGLVGAAMALAGAIVLFRTGSEPARAGRGLCLALAGPVIALAGLQQAIAATGVAAGVGALAIAVAASALWERHGPDPSQRALAAGAMVAVAGLPLGFGATALVLELSAALGAGVPALPLLLALALAAALTAAGAVRAALGLLGREAGHPWAPRRPAAVGVLAVMVSVAGAIVPGAFAGWLNGAVGSAGTLADAGGAAVAGPAGGWPGGYFAVAAILLAGGGLAALSLTTARLRAPDTPAAPAAPSWAAPPAVPLRRVRALRRPRRALHRALPVLDAWISQQPQLPLIAAGGLLAVVLIR